jgi:uncharacterized protein YjiS (DUF1127 family)
MFMPRMRAYNVFQDDERARRDSARTLVGLNALLLRDIGISRYEAETVVDAVPYRVHRMQG